MGLGEDPFATSTTPNYIQQQHQREDPEPDELELGGTSAAPAGRPCTCMIWLDHTILYLVVRHTASLDATLMGMRPFWPAGP